MSVLAPWPNSTADETEVLRVRLYEAEKRRRAKAENLSKSIARLAKIQGNRRKPARVGGKSQF